jgi:ribA/ribD-fused uncharacterized protein
MRQPITDFRGHYRFLSNFSPSPLSVEGVEYPTVEHAYQAMKTLDMRMRRSISSAPTPGIAESMGKRLKLRDDWEKVKLDTMEVLLHLKFQPESPLAERLLATGDAELVEGNTWGDRIWGVCNGVGTNYLGRLLMKQREFLRTGVLQPMLSKIELDDFFA